MVSEAQENKPYILVAKNRFELNCNGWTLWLALKVLFTQIKKKQPSFYGLLCETLIKHKVIDPNATGTEEINKLYKNPHKKPSNKLCGISLAHTNRNL